MSCYYETQMLGTSAELSNSRFNGGVYLLLRRKESFHISLSRKKNKQIFLLFFFNVLLTKVIFTFYVIYESNIVQEGREAISGAAL